MIGRCCCDGAGAALLAAAGQLLVLARWPQRFAACRESLASAEILACLSCLLLLRVPWLPEGDALSRLLPDGALDLPALGCAVVQYFWLARPLRLRTALALLPQQMFLLVTAAALPSLEAPGSGSWALPVLQVRTSCCRRSCAAQADHADDVSVPGNALLCSGES